MLGTIDADSAAVTMLPSGSGNAVILGGAAVGATGSTTITVTTTSDVIDGNTSSISNRMASKGADGAIRLSEAIIAANNTAGADVIALQASATYTFTAADNNQFGPNALPAISSEITISGNNSTIARSGATAFRFFRVRTGATLTLKDVTLDNGLAQGGNGTDLGRGGAGSGGAGLGGAIFNEGTLIVSNSTLSNNSARGGAGGDNNPGVGINSLGGAGGMGANSDD